MAARKQRWDYSTHPGGEEAYEKWVAAKAKLDSLRQDPHATAEQIREAELEMSRHHPSYN